MRVLVVTAVDAERDAVTAALPAGADAQVLTVGVGPAAAAAGTALALSHAGASAAPFELVLNAGIGGGFAPLQPGAIAVAAAAVFADLGAETADGFTPIDELGFGVTRYPVAPALAVQLADRTGGHLGTIVTVATATGTATGAAAPVGRYPDAMAEAMEGAGVAAAAQASGVPFAEVRAISNRVGPRDRDAWDIPLALAALGKAVAAVLG